jgi:outer membrane protein OmpA-like peptidoglycan-associated protein
MFHAFVFRAPRQVLVCCLLAGLVVFASKAGEAQSRPLIPDKPSVEVHLEVLRALKANTAMTSFSAPITEVTVVNKMPGAGSATFAPSGRKIPSEQPMIGQYGVAKGLPQDIPKEVPFARNSSPVRPTAKVASPPAQAGKSTAARPPASSAPTAAKKAQPASPTVIAAPIVAAPAADLEAEAALMKDLENQLPPLKVTKAPRPTLAPPVASKEEKVKAVSPPPAPQLASPPAPQLKPEVTLPDLPPLPVPDKKENTPPLAPTPVPKIVSPEILPPSPPQAAKPETKKPSEVLVVEKDAGKELPPLPPLPLPLEVKANEKPLPPSVEKRIENLFVKQPKKQGVISDTTQRIDPSAKATEEANQKLAREQAAKASQLEADRQAQLAAKEKHDAAPPASPLAALPTSTLPLPPPSTQIAPLPPVPELPESLPMAQAGDVDLPALPALPPLTAITGDAQDKSSLEIVQPADGVLSKDLVSAKPPAPMQPLDAEEKLPKVTSGDAMQAGMEGLPPTLPLSPVAPIQMAQAEKRTAPIVTSAAKPPEAKSPEPKPEAAVASGAVSAVIVFDKDKTDLNEKSKSQLGALAPQIVKNNQQVRIVAYAAGTSEQASIARRISLSRALQIRAFLIDKGVNQLNINVQALGNKVTGGEPERADIFLK